MMNYNVPQVFDLGLILFRNNVTRAPEIKDRLLYILLDMVHAERNGEVIDRTSFANVTQMLVDLGVNSR